MDSLLPGTVVKIEFKLGRCGTCLGTLLCNDAQAIVLEDSEARSLRCIPKHSIKHIETISPPNQKEAFDSVKVCRSYLDSDSDEQSAGVNMESRRARLLAFLKCNNIPVEEVDDLLVAAYSVAINAPYTESNCKSTNAIVLERIQMFVKQFYKEQDLKT